MTATGGLSDSGDPIYFLNKIYRITNEASGGAATYAKLEPALPTFSLAAQSGALTYGTAGTASYAPTFTNFSPAPDAAGDFAIVWTSEAGTTIGTEPTGVTIGFADGNFTLTTAKATPAGTYYFKVTAAKGDKSAVSGVTTLTVSKATPTNTAGSATVTYPGGYFDLSSITGLFTMSGVPATSTYTIETTGSPTGTGAISGSLLNVTKAGTLTIGLVRTPTDSANYNPSVKVTATLTVNKGAAPAAPTGLTASEIATIGGTGTIPGTTAQMEYRVKTTGTYADCAADSTSRLAAGTYEVRLKATDLYEAGAAAEVTISVSDDLAPVQALIDLIGGNPQTYAQLKAIVDAYAALTDAQKSIFDAITDKKTLYDGVLEAYNAVKAVVDAVDAITTLDTNSPTAIGSANALYNALTSGRQAYFGTTEQSAKLTALVASAETAATMQSSINGLTDSSTYTQVMTVNSAYTAMTDADAKAMVDPSNLTAQVARVATAYADVFALETAVAEVKANNERTMSDVAALVTAYDALTGDKQTLFDGLPAKTDYTALVNDHTAANPLYTTLAALVPFETHTPRTDLDTPFAAYNALTDNQKLLIDNTLNLSGDRTVANHITALAAAKVIEGKIDAIEGKVDDAKVSAIFEALESYESADALIKAYVLADKLDALTAARLSLVKLNSIPEADRTINLTKAGGEVDIALTGYNLLAFTLVVFEGSTQVSGDWTPVTTTGDGNAQSASITFPANTSSSAKLYTVKISPDGKEPWYDAFTYTVLVAKGGGGGGGGGSAPSTPKPTVPDSNVIIDGKPVDAGVVTVDKDTGAATTEVNQETFEKQLETARDQVEIKLPEATDEVTTVTAQLVVKNIEDMADKNVTLTVETGGIEYQLPTAAVDTAAILETLDVDDPALAPISITITPIVSDAVQAAVEAAVGEDVIVFPPVEFEVTAHYNGKTVTVDKFTNYVPRAIEITAEQAAKITTAVVVRADGSTYQVPTNVCQKDGKWYATIHSLTNSIYVLIQNEVSFADAKGEWYEAYVNEMGSRQIIAGYDDGTFAGEKSITRGEFAQILVTALGLPKEGVGAAFGDVTATDWFAGAVSTAYEYGLVSGRGNGLFDPMASITRQEAMIMIHNAAKIAAYSGKTGNLSSFDDAELVASWAEDAVKFCVGSGLAGGFDGNIMPTSDISRAETATVILRLLQEADLIDKRS